MLSSYLAAFILLIFILLAILLLAPFSLALNVSKNATLVWGSIKFAWLGLTLKKLEISPRSAEELLASIIKEEDEEERHAVNKRKVGLKDRAIKRIIQLGGKKDRKHDGKNLAKIGLNENGKVSENVTNSHTNSSIDIETGKEAKSRGKDAIRYPSIRSLIDIAPALAEVLWDLLRSIHIKRNFCHLCFGLSDPAQTAMISGYLWFLASALGRSSAEIIIDPWFEGERLEGQLKAEIEARLISPILVLIKALRIREIRSLLREVLGWT